ncbi:DHH family phosphoesterase [Candidatus Falkowbacteria bacterium]|nr:DHH family phosphoesterase [Candidatus Falkowbacteria bacterium]
MTDAQKFLAKIKSSENILIIAHRLPDADTLGAAGALCFYIARQLGQSVEFFCADAIPKSMEFLGLAEFISRSGALNLANCDLIICVDSGDPSQTGIAEQLLARENIFLINIDHHQTNTFYGDLNIVEMSSATAEIVFKLLKSIGVKFTKEISTCLLVGIISDTTYFTNAGTTKESMAIASELLKNQANIKQIIQSTWRKNSPESLRTWGKILSQLHFNEKDKTVTAAIPRGDSVSPEVFEGLANFLTALYEADIIIVMRETDDGFVKCSLRTTKDGIDVAKIAQARGGGGHAKAAGFSVKGHLEKTENGWEIK